MLGSLASKIVLCLDVTIIIALDAAVLNEDVVKKSICLPGCQATLNRQSNNIMEEEVQIHTACDAEKLHRCSQCNMSFQHLNKLQLHANHHIHRDNKMAHNVATLDGPYQCEYCGTAFSSIFEFSRHAQSHVDISKNKIDVEISKSDIKNESNDTSILADSSSITTGKN